ncbi:MAG: hypothetical protein IJ501_04175 [Bacilli bacterium]|nr:hypothetical protein [Bacilli bacterium]
MNKEKFENKLQSKYRVSRYELENLSISKIKNLKIQNQEKLKENSKFKIIKKPLGIILKGAFIGTSIAGCVNTVFPNLVPVGLTYLTTSSDIPNSLKLGILTFLASKPVDLTDGYIILSIGAVTGSFLYSGYVLVKNTTSSLKILHDKKLAKKLNRSL